MEEAFYTALKNVPALAVLALVVKWFLSAMKQMSDAHITYEQARDVRLSQVIRDIGDDCGKAQKECTAVISTNTKTQNEVRVALTELKGCMQGLKQ